MTDDLVWQQYPIDTDHLPPSWSVTSIGEVATAIQPGFPSGAHNSEGRGVPHLRPMNVSRSGTIDLHEMRYVERADGARLARHDVLFNNTNSAELVGKTAAFDLPGDWALSNHMTRIAFPEAIDYRFVASQLHYLWMTGYFRALCVNHVNQASVSSTTVARAAPLVIAPFAEQLRIVGAIEAAFSKLDAGVAYMEATRRRLRQLQAAVVARAVSGELFAASSVSRGDTVQPEHWRVCRVGDVTKSQDYGTSAKSSALPANDDDVPVLRMGNIQSGRIDVAGLKYLPAKHPDFPAKLLAPGDVLFNRTNSPELVGKTAIYSGEPAVAGFASYLIRLRMTDGVLPDWVALYINSRKGRSYMASVRTQQVGQANVNGTKLAAMQIAIPPLPEQEQILNEVSRFETFIDACDRTIATQLNRAAALRRSTLRAAYSGHLVPQVPSDETASVLLDRVSTLRQADRPQRSRTRRQSGERGTK